MFLPLKPCLRTALALLVLPACGSDGRAPVAPAQPPTTCEGIVASNTTAYYGTFRSEFLYVCHLEKAWDDYVAPRRDCVQDDDCAFVPGECRIRSASVNRKYLTQVTAVRELLVTAHRKSVSCSSCGGLGTPPRSKCVNTLCD